MKKKFVLYFIFIICFLLMISFAFIAYAKTCSTAIKAKSYKAELQMMNDFIDKEQQAKKAGKTLVVYYAYSDNTRQLAHMVHAKVGGDILEIQPLELYPSDYDAVYTQSRKEVEEQFKPQLKNKFENIAEYSTIYVGSPIWFNTVAPPVASFLYGQSLAGKRIMPFFTYDGSGVGQGMEEIAKLSPNANIAKGFAVKRTEVGKSEAAINEWLNGLD
ncbi:MAG: flavodoxin [Acidaminococcaceae bacterium]